MIYLFLEHINMLLYKVVTTSTTINTVFIIAIERIFFFLIENGDHRPEVGSLFLESKKNGENLWLVNIFTSCQNTAKKKKKIGFHH